MTHDTLKEHTSMQDIISTIIKDGIHAPSGENSQPWKFVITGNILSIFNTPESDQSLYNSHQKASYLAHGALLETIVISASHYGYQSEVSLFPKKEDPNLVTSVTFTKEETPEDPLYPYIRKRHTNRKDYTGEALSQGEEKSLLESFGDGRYGTCKFVSDTSKLKILGDSVAVNERILMEDSRLHDFFYKHIIWNKNEQNKRSGFYIKTLESLPYKVAGMKLLKSWLLLKIFNTIFGVSSIIFMVYSAKYAKSGSFGLIVAEGNTNEDYVKSGRVLQRLWLTATKLGLAIQPCTGMLYFMKRLEDEHSTPFSKKHTAMIKESYKAIADVFDEQGNLVMLFRIGHADSLPEAVADRMKPSIVIQ